MMGATRGARKTMRKASRRVNMRRGLRWGDEEARGPMRWSIMMMVRRRIP